MGSADLSEEESNEDEESLFPVAPPSTQQPRLLHLLTALSAIGGFLFGYDTGVVSGAMVLIRREWKLTSVWQEIIVSSTVLSAFLASLAGGLVAERCGRRPTILLSSWLFFLAAVLMAASPGRVALLVGRLVAGGGVGLASHTVPLYLSECSPVCQRGSLLTVYQVAITLGQLVAGLTCGALAGRPAGWRGMLGLAALPAAFQLAGFYFMPESPRYLVSAGKADSAGRVLSMLRPRHHSVNLELEEIRAACRTSRVGAGWAGLLATPTSRLALLLGCTLQATQQLAGINTVMYYSAAILVMAGLPDSTSIWLAALTAAFNFVFSLIGLVLVPRLTRRRLLLSSLALVILSLLCISLSFQFISARPNSPAGPGLALFSICLFLTGFAPGLGPLPWAINTELHGSGVRGQAVSVTTATNWFTNLLVSASFLSLVDWLGRPVTFLVYAALTTAGAAVLAKKLPETKVNMIKTKYDNTKNKNNFFFILLSFRGYHSSKQNLFSRKTSQSTAEFSRMMNDIYLFQAKN